MTIRDQIKKILNDIWARPDLHGMEATEYLNQLSALLGNVGEELAKAERDFIAQKVILMEENPKMAVSKIEILAQNTEEYTYYRQVKNMREAMIETIHSLKHRIRVLSDEFNQS